MNYARRKSLVIVLLIFIFCTIFFVFSKGMIVSAETSARVNERKYFTSYVVKSGDSLWTISNQFITDEYANIREYINELMESNRLSSEYIYEGQLLVLPYYADEPVY